MNSEVASALLRNEEFRRLCDTNHFKLTGNRIFVNGNLAAVFMNGTLAQIYDSVTEVAYRTTGDKRRFFEITYKFTDHAEDEGFAGYPVSRDFADDSAVMYDLADCDWDIDVRNRDIAEYDETADASDMPSKLKESADE